MKYKKFSICMSISLFLGVYWAIWHGSGAEGLYFGVIGFIVGLAIEGFDWLIIKSSRRRRKEDIIKKHYD
jgi:hypothetical protein